MGKRDGDESGSADCGCLKLATEEGGGYLHYRLLALLKQIIEHPATLVGIATCTGERKVVPLLSRILEQAFGEKWAWCDDATPHRFYNKGNECSVYVWAGDMEWERVATKGRHRYQKDCKKIWESLSEQFPRMGAENTLCLDLGFNNVTPADNIVVFPEWRWARTSDSIDDESRFRENLMTILNDSSLEHVRQQLDQGRVALTSSTTIRLLTQLQDVDLLAFYKSCRFDFKVTCYSSDEACWWEAIEHT